MNHDKILLAHGGGGSLMADLINKTIRPCLWGQSGPALLDAAAIDIPGQNLLLTTDSFVVNPLFFPGGDIGKLAVCGTVNDLAVCGAKPVAMSLSLIIEEGLELEKLERILQSIGQTARAADVPIITGDTKVVETGAADGIFINTAAVGQKLQKADLAFGRIKPGDALIINGTLGDHGMTVLSRQKDMSFQSALQSDCACLYELCALLINSLGSDVKFMRDPTRGGLAAVANEIAVAAGCSIQLDESAIPVRPVVRAAAEMLGLDILNVANEGKIIAVVSSRAAPKALELLRGDMLGKDAAVIGSILEADARPIVELKTTIGGRRIVQMPYGRDLPRIC